MFSISIQKDGSKVFHAHQPKAKAKAQTYNNVDASWGPQSAQAIANRKALEDSIIKAKVLAAEEASRKELHKFLAERSNNPNKASYHFQT